jgi:carbonic anhydrase
VLPAVAGTLQYAGVHLATPLFVVLGHDRCGAVEARSQPSSTAFARSRIEVIILSMLPGLAAVDRKLPPFGRDRTAQSF